MPKNATTSKSLREEEDRQLKQELLALAKSGAPRPKPGTRLGDALIRFTTPSIDRHWRAHHEAAHAVVAYRLGAEVDSVSIKRDGESGGRCFTRPQKDWAAEMIVSLAGYYGQLSAGCPRRIARMTSAGDFAEAMRIEADCGLPVAILRKRAARIVAKEWPIIESVADRLLESTTLQGSEVEAIAGPTLWRYRTGISLAAHMSCRAGRA